MNLLSIFRRAPAKPKEINTPRTDAALYQIGGVWGDHVRWLTYPTRAWGHAPVVPREGDVLACEMESGKTGVWLFQKVERQSNPTDMFFADVLGLGYTDEIDFALPKPPVDPLLDLRRFATIR